MLSLNLCHSVFVAGGFKPFCAVKMASAIQAVVAVGFQRHSAAPHTTAGAFHESLGRRLADVMEGDRYVLHQVASLAESASRLWCGKVPNLH
jgi:hypothetical protein